MWDDLTKQIRGILSRQGAEVLGITRWDERKLAYPVGKQKRGTYVLSFFALAGPAGLVEVERDCQLADEILRVLIVRADQFKVADMRVQLGEDIDEAAAARLAEERGETAPAQPEQAAETTGE
jgi:small subunit ribosomal protein S6